MNKVSKFFLTFLILFNLLPIVGVEAASLPIYRAYNPLTGEHLYSSSAWEDFVLTYSRGWTHEGVSWYYKEEGSKVYRLYNPEIDDHLYTSDIYEINTILTYGCWLLDNNGYALFFSGGNVPVYRLYNQKSGRHLLTTDLNEYNTLSQGDWIQEGIAMYGYSS